MARVLCLLFVAPLIIGLMVFGWAPAVSATPSEHLNWGASLSSYGSDYSCPSGPLVINVKQRVLNDVDSGLQGYWAFDDLVRSIQVVQVGVGAFCATVKYQGQFATIGGPAPGPVGTVGQGVVGTFQGGYTSTVFTADLIPSPAWRTMGNVGTTDYQCDASANCPGYVDWVGIYFTNVSGFDLAWWGWVYHAGNNGSWVNSFDGNSGNITGE